MSNSDERREIWWPSPSVELAKVVKLDSGDLLATVHGATLGGIQFSYESWGELNAARDNVVLIVHPLASDPHATGEFAGQTRGWWEPLIGPGRPIDTERHFVVCPNLLGGCYGSTGPRFPHPDGEPYLDRFPLLTPLDLMRAQRMFLKQLGIERLQLVVGPSMGGMIAWEWAIEAGKDVERVVVVAAPLRTTALQIGLNWLQRRGIELDLTGDEQAAKWGQMIARGVGMLSYRSPIGLEQRFGRDWFKQPSGTLGERGIFNIESWLRHHGKKAVRRYDPYTYMLFSRAMDLHDVGEGRGGFVSALDRVACRVTVVGISSDQLYPPSDVHLGAEVMDHLGKRATWQLISSPHGHDAFLLETDQLGAIIRSTKGVPSAAFAAPVPADVRTARLGILGAGRVSAMLVRLLADRREDLLERFDLRFEVAAVAEVDRNKKLDDVFNTLEVTHDPEQLAKREDLDVILDLTRGTGSRTLVETALARGRSVVTPNKTLVREHGAALERLALDHGVRLAFHNSIAAGWPLLYSIESPLGRRRVQSVQAILSTTCNVMLGRIEAGDSFTEALEVARSLRLPEPDADLDLSGWDTVQKLQILVARSCGRRFATDRIAIRGIHDVNPEIVRQSVQLGYRVKLIGLFLNLAPEPVIGVQPAAVPIEGTLGGVNGDDNAVILTDRDGGEFVFAGKGVGELPVASAVLGDLVGLFRPRQSWTGRYPLAVRVPRAPEFARFIALEGASKATIVDGPAEGAVPLLDTLVHPRGAGQPTGP